jgi:hypothetical protein
MFRRISHCSLGCLAIGFMLGCGGSDACNAESVRADRLNSDERCYDESTTLNLDVCSKGGTKGVQTQCVASPEGALYHVLLALGARVEGPAGWRGEADLTEAEKQTCDDLLESDVGNCTD